MGLPKGAPSGYAFSDDLSFARLPVQPDLFCYVSFRLKKSVPKVRPQSTENIRESKEILHEIEKKLRFRDDAPHFEHQQVLYTLHII